MGASLICDFRRGCVNLKNAFGHIGINSAATIQSFPHLAEALLLTGLASRAEAVEMALALQEARQCPMKGCTCLAWTEANMIADVA